MGFEAIQYRAGVRLQMRANRVAVCAEELLSPTLFGWKIA